MSLSKRARDYGAAILLHSLRSVADSLYSGQNYTGLAQGLGESPGFGHLSDRISCASADHESIVVLYDLKAEEEVRCTKFKPDDYCLFQDLPEPQEPHGQILFLRGHLSAEWIKVIGARYRVDPEFFHRHLAFSSASIYESVFALPSLPSSTRNIIRIGVPTIACLDPSAAVSDLTDLQDVQSEHASVMDRYFRTFGKLAKAGDSVVRSYKTLSERFSLIEQDISICLETSGKAWTAIVWLDNGDNLERSPKGPWMNRSGAGATALTLLPVQQYIKHVALKSMLPQTGPNGKPSETSANQRPLTKQSYLQSGSLLPLQYCRFLNHEVAANDFIFALAEVFRFAAYAEAQCLNLLQTLIENVARQRPQMHDPLSCGKAEPIQILLEYKTILDRHQQRLQETLATLRRRENSGWPRADKEPHRRKAVNEARRLEEDYQHLVTRTRELATACQEGMAMLMNGAVIHEAKKAIEQTERMKKLTMLATFFIPLNFTSSVFGMNFREFGNQSVLSIWVWVAVTVPIVFLTVIMYMYDMNTLKKRLKWLANIRRNGGNR